jgi:branched-chain amino acid transport system permease protein
VGAVLFAVIGMAAVGIVFNRLVLRRMIMRPVISLIMVTLGLGAVLRGVDSFLFVGIPGGIPLPLPSDPILVAGVPLAVDKVAAAAIAGCCTALIAWFARRSRTGIAWRAIADDPSAASAAGIDLQHQFTLLWLLTGLIAVIGGLLWTTIAGSGFGVALVGLKIFPIVVIGGLDSVAGTIAGAMIIGTVESLGAGYLDPQLGGGFGALASYLLLFTVLGIRPYGLFGQPHIERV